MAQKLLELKSRSETQSSSHIQFVSIIVCRVIDQVSSYEFRASGGKYKQSQSFRVLLKKKKYIWA